MKKFYKFITNNSVLVVIICFLLLIPAFIGFKCTKINYNILSYLPSDIETIKGQDILTNDFGIGAFSFVMVDNMSNKDILNVEKKFRNIDHVTDVMSIADFTDTVMPLSMLPDNITDKIIDNNGTVVVVIFDTSTSEEATINAVEDIRGIMNNASTVSGMTSMIMDTRDLSNGEILAYIIVAVALCLIVLTISTDSYIIPILLLSNIGVAILYNMGSNIILGNISYITKAISAVLQLGVTTDFSIFLYHKYEQAKEKEKNKRVAMQLAMADTFKSICGSSLTTIAGFLALCTMNLTLGTDIGVVMAKGVLFGLLCVMVLFPSLLLMFDKYIVKFSHKIIFPNFKKLQNFIVKRYKYILIVFLILLIPALYGNKNVNVYYKLDKSLPTTLPSSIANSELAKRYNIVSPEIILIDKNIKQNDLEDLVSKLKDVEGIDLVLAPSQIKSSGIQDSMLPSDLTNMFESEKYELIILNSEYEVASNKLNNQIDEINHIVKKYDKKSITAGEGALTKDLIKLADHDFNMVNYVSILVVFIIIALVLKSVSLPFILICTIEFAIFVNMAIAFYTGTTLPFVASIIIGTIQLGSTIDYAILLSTKYLDERKINKDKMIAIKNTLASTTTSIITSALSLFAATFGVFVYSKIDMIGSICELLARGSIISMIVVLFVLPSLLIVFDKLIMKTTKNMKEVL